MRDDTQGRFNAGAGAWAHYNQGPLGRIRQCVTWHNLAPHLPRPSHEPPGAWVLDAGGGSGELALKLVQQGYRVCLMDYAPAMLDQARRQACNLPEPARQRLALCQMAVGDAGCAFAPNTFGAITCHTLIEYLPEPRMALRRLAELLVGGGVLSLTFVNRHAQVLRQVWSQGDPMSALDVLKDGDFCASLFDVRGNAYSADEVQGWLTSDGLKIRAVYGVRFFADYVPRQRLDEPEFFVELLELEKRTAARFPYAALARYVHIVAYKDAEHSKVLSR
jgi:S-adenosylmethionine-dependent methyltransferase